MVVGMAAALVIPGAALPAVVGLLAGAIALGRLARTEVWAREAITDLWAMVALTLGALAGAPPVAHPLTVAAHHMAGPTNLFELVTSPVVVLSAWLLARAALAVVARRRGERMRHSFLTATATIAQFLLMLLAH